MKNCTLLAYFILSSLITSGQKDTTFFFDEFNISINRNYQKENNSKDGFGFGIGAYHNFMTDQKVSLRYGFEFNRTRQYFKYEYMGHFSSNSDVIYHINSLSIPSAARLSLGNKIIFFLEPGLFIDLNMGARSKGTIHWIEAYEYPQIVYYEKTFNTKENISILNYGYSFGIGLKIPVERYELIIKSEYKRGIILLNSQPLYNSYIRLIIGLKIKYIGNIHERI